MAQLALFVSISRLQIATELIINVTKECNFRSAYTAYGTNSFICSISRMQDATVANNTSSLYAFHIFISTLLVHPQYFL